MCWREINTYLRGIAVFVLLLGLSLPLRAQEVTYLTQEQFREKIFDYQTENEWLYKGTENVVIDFYFTWCKPCKMLAPIMEELAKEYKGQITFYKVDAEREISLSRAFGIQSCPTVLLITKDKMMNPYLVSGYRDKAEWQYFFQRAFGLEAK